jgi:uncharacterized protein VirK/YbjX
LKVSCLHLSLWLAIQRSVRLFRNLDATLPLLVAGSQVRRLIRRRPELVLSIATKPFITSRWDARTRTAVLIDHCRTVAHIGGLVDFPENGSVELLRLAGVEGSYRLTLEQSRWLQTEGLMTFGLCEDADRFFQLSFCLSTRSGELITYVGGIQGVPRPNGLDQHRRFTRRTYGMRPRDFLVETFRLFCRSLGVRTILAVSDSSHVNALSTKASLPPTYDRLWIERGGQLAEDGFFVLSPTLKRRAPDDIPRRKQALYRRRYELLEQIGRDFFSRSEDSNNHGRGSGP